MEKPCLILDLDETVISTLSRDEINALPNKERNWLKGRLDTLSKYDWHDDRIPPPRMNQKPKGDDYITFERPGLQTFLDYAFENFKVYIWTAGSPEYAARLVENIILRRNKEKRRIQSILSSYHTSLSDNNFKNLKDLRIFWKTFRSIPEFKGCGRANTIIMDDNPEVYRYNKRNCIFMRPFDMSNPLDAQQDDFLATVQSQLEVITANLDEDEKATSLAIATYGRDSDEVEEASKTVRELLDSRRPMDVSAVNFLNGME